MANTKLSIMSILAANYSKMNSGHGAQHSQWRQWLAALAASSVMLSSGVDTIRATNMNYSVSVFQNALSNIGCVMIGAILGVVFADIYGRKRTLLVASLFVIPRLASSNFDSANFSWINEMFINVGSGIICTVVPLYISEIADTNIRATLMVVQLSVLTLEVLILNTLYGVLRFYYLIRWHKIISNAFLIILTLFHVIILAILPETPQYLNWKKRYEEASGSLAYFRGVNYVKVEGEASEKLVNAQLNNNEQSWMKKFSEIIKFENRRSLAIIFALIAFKRACGQRRNEMDLIRLLIVNDTMIYYLPLGIWAVRLAFTICIMFLIDVGGRKLSLLIVISCSFFATIILLTPLANYHWISFPSLSVPILGYVVFAAVELAYVGTFFPINVRAIATAVVISFNILSRNVALAIEHLLLVYPMLVVSFVISALALFCGIFVVLIFFPKTNYVPCSEITTEIPVHGESASDNV